MTWPFILDFQIQLRQFLHFLYENHHKTLRNIPYLPHTQSWKMKTNGDFAFSRGPCAGSDYRNSSSAGVPPWRLTSGFTQGSGLQTNFHWWCWQQFFHWLQLGINWFLLSRPTTEYLRPLQFLNFINYYRSQKLSEIKHFYWVKKKNPRLKSCWPPYVYFFNNLQIKMLYLSKEIHLIL